MKNLFYFFNIILFLSIFISCSSSDSANSTVVSPTVITATEDTSNITFNATLSSNLAQSPSRNYNSKKAIGVIGDISQIVALAVKDGVFDNTRTRTSTVSTDGSFEIELSQDTEWVLMTANPTASTLEDRIGNFISISEGNSYLSLMPISNASGDINAGFLSALANETDSSNTISQLSTAFGLSTNDLLNLSNIDGLTKYVKNSYLNNDPNSNIVFIPRIIYDFNSLDVTYNTMSDPSTYVYSNMITRIHSNHPSFTVDNNLTIIEPIDLNVSSVVVGTAFLSPNTMVEIPTVNPVPQGYYKINDNGVTLGVFDLAVGNIFDENNKITGIAPAVRLRVDSSGKTDGVFISMYMFSKANQVYEKITDRKIISSYSKFAWVDFGSSGDFLPYSYDLYFDTLKAVDNLAGGQQNIPYSNGEFFINFSAGPHNADGVVTLRLFMNLAGNIQVGHDFTFSP